MSDRSHELWIFRQQHAYKPLPQGDFIRLMHLEPALHPDAPLRFAFTQGAVSDLVAEYEAVSYTWGESKLHCSLYVEDGSRVMVTRNLDKVLRRLRHPTTNRALWADAVCINQADDNEKSKQIPLMGQIFRSASRVLAWLDGGVEEEQGMHILNKITRPTPSVAYGTSVQLWEKADESFFFRNGMLMIHKLLSLAWFTRVWIIQEIVMNMDAMLICGTSEITWHRFTVAIEFLRNLPSGTADSVVGHKLDALQVIINLWKSHNMAVKFRRRVHEVDQHKLTVDIAKPPHQEGIVSIMDKLSSYNCADIQPHFQAVQNLTKYMFPSVEHFRNYFQKYAENPSALCTFKGHPTQEASLVVQMSVDYSLDTRQVYQAFATACIARSRIVPILNAVLARQDSSSSEGWPTWTPDWRKTPSATYIPLDSGALNCRQVTSDIIAVLGHGPHTSLHNFLEVDEPIPVPEGRTAFHIFLTDICIDWPLSAVEIILGGLLPNRTKEEVRGLVLYLTDSMDLTSDISEMLLLVQATMRSRCFFTARNTWHTVKYYGYGNTFITKGDRLLSLDHWKSPTELSLNFPQAFHLRPKGPGKVDENTTYRLMGSAQFTPNLYRFELDSDWDKFVEHLYLE
jgi:hypothetical protein